MFSAWTLKLVFNMLTIMCLSSNGTLGNKFINTCLLMSWVVWGRFATSKMIGIKSRFFKDWLVGTSNVQSPTHPNRNRLHKLNPPASKSPRKNVLSTWCFKWTLIVLTTPASRWPCSPRISKFFPVRSLNLCGSLLRMTKRMLENDSAINKTDSLGILNSCTKSGLDGNSPRMNHRFDGCRLSFGLT